jgi:hypothetical protein
MTLLKWTLIVIAGFGAAYAAAFAFGAWRWSGTTRELLAALDAGACPLALRDIHLMNCQVCPPPCSAISAPC